MVTRIELLEIHNLNWNFFIDLEPGEIQFITHNNPDAKREVFAIYCARDDGFTSIERSPRITIQTEGKIEEIEDMASTKLVTELKKGQHYYLNAKPDGATSGTLLKISHE